MDDSSDSDHDPQVGRYVVPQKKKRRLDETISISEMNRLVAEKVSEILKTNPSLPKSNNNSEKYKEKAELLPLFDPENSCVTALNWLHKIEQIGMINGWNDETKSFCMQSRLAGLAKVWYNGLDNYDITWDEWKLALIRAFPSHTDFVDLLKQMLGRHKQQDESMMHYFYSKNMLVGRCGLTDTKAVSCIIDGLPADLQANAKAGNYQTPDDLFYNFLSKQDKGKNPLESKSRNDYARNQYQGTSGQFRCHICKKLGHKARHCQQSGQFRGNNGNTKPRTSAIRCSLCGKSGHVEHHCWTMTKPTCNQCGKIGHKAQECWTRPSTSTTATPTTGCTKCGKPGHVADRCWSNNGRAKLKDVKMLQRQVSNSVYNIIVKIDGHNFNGYIDTGSQINVANISVARRLNLKLKHTDIVIRGFGNSVIMPEGCAQVEVNIGDISIVTLILFVATEMNSYDVIVGQPVINSSGVVFTVSGGKVELKPIENNIPKQIVTEKVPIQVFEHTHIPGLSTKRVIISLDSFDDIIFVSAQLHTGLQKYSVPSGVINGPVQTINVVNWGTKPICLSKGDVLVKGLRVAVPDKITVIPEIDTHNILSLELGKINCEHLADTDRDNLFKLLQKVTAKKRPIPGYFTAEGAASLGNLDSMSTAAEPTENRKE
ncbi:hypothetical protein NQ315_014635 [Exocentrus adspersus]|uniref:CCHC-type domain-containing protein n=1 Tax=Exocentrus adspersus TaxID=1586481 RepID=A0AAV8VQ79_9CUCU|nr:hypothetical protein NQ315_014635 [Exocentrus adspersus]